MSEIRPSVLWFARWMEQKLRINDSKKTGWGTESFIFLFARLFDEVHELEKALSQYLTQDYPKTDKIKEAVISECADVANFAHMIADKIRGCPNGPRGKEESPA